MLLNVNTSLQVAKAPKNTVAFQWSIIALSWFLSPTEAVALLPFPLPGVTQEEPVWPRWLLTADTAKVNEQRSLRPQSLGSMCYCCRSGKGIPFMSTGLISRMQHFMFINIYVRMSCVCV